MKKSKFQIGQTVTVIDKCHRYPYYDKMAEIMRLTNWSPNGPMQNGGIATIVAVELHPDSYTKTYLYGVQLPCGGQVIIGEGGLQLSTNDIIKINRDTLNSYWDAATMSQREYINKHFQLDGTTTVDAIIKLHSIACDTWKGIIKTNHPDCFPVTKSAIELAVEKAGTPNYSGFLNVKILDDLILVKLPTANKEWSLTAFEWVIKFCKENPSSYPVHRNGHNNADYLYIQWNA